MWRLRLVRGTSSPPLVHVHDHVTFGRAPEASVMVRDPAASRLHARVSVEADGLWATDLGSANGTFADGARAEKARLLAGSHLRIGDTEFVVEDDQAAATPDTPPDRRRPIPGSTLLRLAAVAGPPQGGVDSEAVALSDAVAKEDDAIARFRRFARGAASVANADAAWVCVRATAGGPWLLAGRHPADGTGDPPPIARAVLARVSRSGEAVLLTTDDRAGRGEPGTQQSVGLAMCAPIGPASGSGALLLAERRDAARPFRTADLSPFAALAAQAGPSLAADLGWFRWRAIHAPSGTEGAAPVLVGESAAIQRVLDVTEHIAASRSPVLIRGDAGSGRRTFAALLHSIGETRSRPFLCVPCAALPAGEEAIALFGELSGARRRPGLLDDAGDGTVCLAEIADLAPAVHQALADALMQWRWRPVGGAASSVLRTRLIATTSRNLLELVSQGTFHAGVAAAFSTVTLSIPSLAARTDDIPLLAAHFAAVHGRRHRGRPCVLDDAAARALATRTFPGQVAELSALVERAVIASPSDTLDTTAFEPAPRDAESDNLSLEAATCRAVRRALEVTGGHRREAARRLGISAPTLRRRMEDFKLDSAGE